MPIYVYQSKSGHVVEQFFHLGAEPQRIKVDVGGKKEWAVKTIAPEYKRELRPGWPMLSTALGVHPDEIDEARKHMASRGVDVDFEPAEGRAILRSHQHRKQVLRALGYSDKDGYD